MQRPTPSRRTPSCPSSVMFLATLLPLLALLFLAASATPLHAQNRATISKVPPVYPSIARQMGITGVVMVSATVDASGKVIKAESASGNKLLAPSAIEAVKQWKFTPGEGTVTVTVSVTFEKG